MAGEVTTTRGRREGPRVWPLRRLSRVTAAVLPHALVIWPAPRGDPQPSDKEASRSPEGRRAADGGLRPDEAAARGAGRGGRVERALLTCVPHRTGLRGPSARDSSPPSARPHTTPLLAVHLSVIQTARRRRRPSSPRSLPVPPSSPPRRLVVGIRLRPIVSLELREPPLIGSFGQLFENKRGRRGACADVRGAGVA